MFFVALGGFGGCAKENWQSFQENSKADPTRAMSPPGILKRRLFPEPAQVEQDTQEAAERAEEEVPTHDEEVSVEDEIPPGQKHPDLELEGSGGRDGKPCCSGQRYLSGHGV